MDRIEAVSGEGARGPNMTVGERMVLDGGPPSGPPDPLVGPLDTSSELPAVLFGLPTLQEVVDPA